MCVFSLCRYYCSTCTVDLNIKVKYLIMINGNLSFNMLLSSIWFNQRNPKLAS